MEPKAEYIPSEDEHNRRMVAEKLEQMAAIVRSGEMSVSKFSFDITPGVSMRIDVEVAPARPVIEGEERQMTLYLTEVPHDRPD